MTTNPDRGGAKIILDPCAIHLSGGRCKFEGLLIKFSRAFLIRNRNGDERHFICDHLQTPFSFSGFTLSRSSKSQFPNPRQNSIAKSQKRQRCHPLFEMIDAKIKVNSRASAARASRLAALFFVMPTSTNRKNKRLSFASFRQIFARIRKSFLLSASSASIQLAATEPDARTNCLTSSVLLIVLGSCFTNTRTDCANSNVRSSKVARFSAVFHFGVGI